MKQQSRAKRGGSNHTNNNSKRTQGELKKAAEMGLQQQLIDKNDDDHSSNSSSSSSTVSSSSQQQQSSVDYEAEDENEDRQQRRPKHSNENESLLHVQNFLKCFGPNAYAKTNVPAAATKALGKGELRAWRQNYRNTINSVPATATAVADNPTVQTSQTPIVDITGATATAINTTALFQAQSQSSSGHKPPTTKFQINTKFLRKPRNKLMKMLPTATTTTSQQELEQPQQLQLLNDDSNAKFKDFSIDSLLNK
nr:uncharacterized protein LOC108081020 [Drosophila kikkawai]